LWGFQLEIPFFLEHVEKRLKEELDRVVTFLDSATRKPLVSLVEHHLLAPHVSSILDKGFEALAVCFFSSSSSYYFIYRILLIPIVMFTKPERQPI